MEPKKTYLSRYLLAISLKMNSSSKIFVLQIRIGDHQKSRRTSTSHAERESRDVSRTLQSDEGESVDSVSIDGFLVQQF